MSTGSFFAIDKATWPHVVDLGMNSAVAYLVLARFSGKDNATTAASTNAVETHTGIARSRAKAAIDALLRAGLLRQTKPLMKPGSHPLYKILDRAGKQTERLGPGKQPERIWLPNALVTGASTETPPVEVVRQTQDVMTLRLLVELYSAQNLREDGGVSRALIHKTHARHRVGESGAFVVWGFEPGRSWINWGSRVTFIAASRRRRK